MNEVTHEGNFSETLLSYCVIYKMVACISLSNFSQPSGQTDVGRMVDVG